jgi:hypothetical protein
MGLGASMSSASRPCTLPWARPMRSRPAGVSALSNHWVVSAKVWRWVSGAGSTAKPASGKTRTSGVSSR